MPKLALKLIKQKEKQMDGAVKILDFESAAILRDEILELNKMLKTTLDILPTETKSHSELRSNTGMKSVNKGPKIKNPRNKDLLM